MSDNYTIPSHLQIALESISVFSNDGQIDLNELEHLLSIAEQDNKIDSDEARVLSNILKRALEGEIDTETMARIQVVSEKIMRSNS